MQIAKPDFISPNNVRVYQLLNDKEFRLTITNILSESKNTFSYKVKSQICENWPITLEEINLVLRYIIDPENESPYSDTPTVIILPPVDDSDKPVNQYVEIQIYPGATEKDLSESLNKVKEHWLQIWTKEKRVKPPQHLDFLYAVAMQRRAGKSYKEIALSVQNKALPKFQGKRAPSDSLNDELAIRQYYTKYKKWVVL